MLERQSMASQGSELSGKQREVLLYKGRINETAKEILILLHKSDPSLTIENYPVELKLKFQEIFYSLSCIATIVGGRLTEGVSKGMDKLRNGLLDIELSGEPLGAHRVLIEDWLIMANSVYVQFDNAGRPTKVAFDIAALGLRFKGLVKR